MFALMCMLQMTSTQERNSKQLKLLQITERRKRINSISTALADGRVTGSEIMECQKKGADIQDLIDFEDQAQGWLEENEGNIRSDFDAMIANGYFTQNGQAPDAEQEEELYYQFLEAKDMEHRMQMLEEYKVRLKELEQEIDQEKALTELELKEEEACIQAYKGQAEKEAQEQAPKF